MAGLVPDDYLQFFHEHVLRPDAPVQVYQQRLLIHAKRGATAMYPVVEPLLDRVAQALYNSPDIVVLAFVLVVLVLALQVLAWLKRAVMWGTRLVFRVIFWACVAALLAIVWQRGLEATTRDLVVIAGKIAGYAAVVRDIWLSEYQKYQAQAQGGRIPNGAAAGRAKMRAPR